VKLEEVSYEAVMMERHRNVGVNDDADALAALRTYGLQSSIENMTPSAAHSCTSIFKIAANILMYVSECMLYARWRKKGNSLRSETQHSSLQIPESCFLYTDLDEYAFHAAHWSSNC